MARICGDGFALGGVQAVEQVGNIHRRILRWPARYPASLRLPHNRAMRVLPALWLLFACFLPAWTMPAGAQERIVRAGDTALVIDVEGVDDPARRAMLQDWAEEAARALLTSARRFPLPRATVKIMPSDERDGSPVPWGQTQRRDGVSVLLYVRRDATLAELRADWTAVHEFSHLLHPWLGRDGRWMAEGLASYYQNVLRARAGLMPADEAWRRLDAGFGRGRRATDPGTPLFSARGRGATMRIYWAGAAYWLQADLALRARGSSLDAVLAAYARCCLSPATESSPLAFARTLDQIDGQGLFERLYREAAAATAFPDLSAAYTTLGLSKTADGLRLSRDDAPAQLRAAITRPALGSQSK
jgi:hypothetical protein